jgi:hypothetical protein
MKNSTNKIITNRRDAMKLFTAEGFAGLLGLFGSPLAMAGNEE